MPTRTVLIVLFDGVQSLDVTGPLEVFTGAARATAGEPAYRVTTASLGGAPIRTSSGLTLVPDTYLRDVYTTHTLLVPGGDGTRSPDPELVAWLRRHAPRASRIVSVCSGALLLAEAGLLAGRRATTHWAVCDTLARRFPDVEVDPDPIFVRDGNVATSAGVTAGIDLALALVADAELADVPRPDIVLVPGGPGQTAHMESGPVHEWLRAADATSTWTTSVCTGSLILAAAGLLAGRGATSHWLVLDQLPALGVTPVRERVVFDGKYVTAAGVSSGIDMALTLAGRTAGDEVAQAIQLGTEYDPQPPYDAGSPGKAPGEVVDALQARSRFILTGQ